MLNSSLIDKQYKWLVGFTDGSFNCLINKNNQYKFYLQYHLHIDDEECINNIKNILNYLNKYEIHNKTVNLKISNQ